MRSTAKRSASALRIVDREDQSTWAMTRLLLVEKGACRAALGGGPDGEVEPPGSAEGDFDRRLCDLAVLRRLSAKPEAMGVG